MRKILIVLLSVAILATSQGAAFAAPKLALNPANHMNPGAIKGYTEAGGMIDIAKRAQTYAGSQGVNTGIFWNGLKRSGHNISSLKNEVAGANRFGASSFIAMHSDGVPKSRGILVLYSTPKSARMGSVIGGYIAKKMGLKYEGLSYRPGLMVLRQSKATPILIEYLSHANLGDNRKLSDPNYRQQLAEATIEGYLKYMNYRIRSTRAKPARPAAVARPVSGSQTNAVAPKVKGDGVEKRVAMNNVMKLNQVKPKKTVVKLNAVSSDESSPVQSAVGSKSSNGEAEKAESGAVNGIVNLTLNYFKVSLGLGGVAQ